MLIPSSLSSLSLDSRHLQKGEWARSTTRNASEKESQRQNLFNHEEKRETSQELYKSVRDNFLGPVSSDNNNSILSDIEAAESIGGCTIDFQI